MVELLEDVEAGGTTDAGGAGAGKGARGEGGGERGGGGGAGTGGTLPRVASVETLRLEEGATVARQLYVLTVREDKSRRGANLTLINAAQMCIMGILTGLFWWQMPDETDEFVMERFSILFFTIIAQSNAVVFTCVNTFARERQLMLRENAKGMYHPLPFFIAKTMSDTVNTLVLPCFYATVTYWAVGLRRTGEAYFVFLSAFALCILVRRLRKRGWGGGA